MCFSAQNSDVAGCVTLNRAGIHAYQKGLRPRQLAFGAWRPAVLSKGHERMTRCALLGFGISDDLADIKTMRFGLLLPN